MTIYQHKPVYFYATQVDEGNRDTLQDILTVEDGHGCFLKNGDWVTQNVETKKYVVMSDIRFKEDMDKF